MELTIGATYNLNFVIDNDLFTVPAQLQGDVVTRQGQNFLVFKRELSDGTIKPYYYTFEAFVAMQGTTHDNAFAEGEVITADSLASI